METYPTLNGSFHRRALQLRTRAVVAIAVLAAAARALAGVDLGLPLAASPEAQGFSSDRIVRIGAMFNRVIAEGDYAGATWLVIRNGQIVTHGASGYADLAAKKPMTEDTVFRIMSMTKLVTAVTVLTFVEEGRINLDDPVERYLPQLAHPKVYTGGTAEAPILVAATSSVTIRQLLTHTSGYTYGFFDAGPVRDLYLKADLWTAPTLAAFVTRVAHLPLVFQPGTAWKYGVNLDLLGAVIEKVSGQPFEKVVQDRVLHPLGMSETSFATPKDPGRLAKIYQHDAKGLTEIPPFIDPPFASGGGGLYSTLHDYARFAQMLLNDGILEGNRILGPKTVEMMRSNEVGYLNPRPIEHYVPQGFGFAVRVQLDDRSSATSLVSPGTYGWEGILTTYVSIDPREHLVLLSMLQHQPYDDGQIFERYSNTVYQAIVR